MSTRLKSVHSIMGRTDYLRTSTGSNLIFRRIVQKSIIWRDITNVIIIIFDIFEGLTYALMFLIITEAGRFNLFYRYYS